jgi:hypothetical protein
MNWWWDAVQTSEKVKWKFLLHPSECSFETLKPVHID